jgi:hypothetical protein
MFGGVWRSVCVCVDGLMANHSPPKTEETTHNKPNDQKTYSPLWFHLVPVIPEHYSPPYNHIYYVMMTMHTKNHPLILLVSILVVWAYHVAGFVVVPSSSSSSSSRPAVIGGGGGVSRPSCLFVSTTPTTPTELTAVEQNEEDSSGNDENDTNNTSKEPVNVVVSDTTTSTDNVDVDVDDTNADVILEENELSTVTTTSTSSDHKVDTKESRPTTTGTTSSFNKKRRTTRHTLFVGNLPFGTCG